jgi:hypothetical protein
MENTYFSPSGMIWFGKPSNVAISKKGRFVFFNRPAHQKYECIIEFWEKHKKKFLGITYKSEIKVIAIFKVKLKAE